MHLPRYIEPLSGETYPLETPRWRAKNGLPIGITPLPGIGRGDIASHVRSLWRYAGALPLEVPSPITMGEGCTPLVECNWRGEAKGLFKLEWFSPTGSFKDRGASVMVSVLKQQGVQAILEDSSGNGGAAIAGYAALAGMKAKILVPASTQPGKIVQSRIYGAEIELIPGTRQATADEAERQAEQIFYASHNWQPFFLQGTKLLAYELWEDLGFTAPDNIIIPTGAGSNVLGCDIGFDELLRRGEINKRPRLIASQPQNCAPLHESFVRGGEFQPVDPKPTIAEGTAIAKPVRAREVLEALRRSEGCTVALTEEEIVAALHDLAAMGLYCEPTCASAPAAYSKLLADGTITPDQITVMILTGSGLKATQRVGELLNGG